MSTAALTIFVAATALTMLVGAAALNLWERKLPEAFEHLGWAATVAHLAMLAAAWAAAASNGCEPLAPTPPLAALPTAVYDTTAWVAVVSFVASTAGYALRLRRSRVTRGGDAM